jgi:hypothetical protein
MRAGVDMYGCKSFLHAQRWAGLEDLCAGMIDTVLSTGRWRVDRCHGIRHIINFRVSAYMIAYCLMPLGTLCPSVLAIRLLGDHRLIVEKGSRNVIARRERV